MMPLRRQGQRSGTEISARRSRQDLRSQRGLFVVHSLVCRLEVEQRKLGGVDLAAAVD